MGDEGRMYPFRFLSATLTILQIIYLSCVGPVFLAAFLEWFLWLAAFCYCLCKAFRKADHWSQRVLASLFIFLFVIIRYASQAQPFRFSDHMAEAPSYLS